jgi:hypothetical protein
MLPKEPSLHVTAISLGHGRYRLKVTVRIAGAGANEAVVDVEPVSHAKVRIGRRTIYTNHDGAAIIEITRSRRLTITAGETLKPALANLR